MARPFKLGPAILHTSDSTAHVPDLSREALLKRLDSVSRVAVCQTCKTALHWLLSEEQQAQLSLAVPGSGSQSPDQHLRRMLSVQTQLARRKDKHTVVLIKQQGHIAGGDTSWYHILFTAISGSVSSTFTLSLQLQLIPLQLLTFIGRALTSLSRPELATPTEKHSTIEFPDPAALPSLQHLIVHRVASGAQARMWDSLRPYVKQLVSQ